MSRIAVISPHLDDAVFSVGEHMLSRPDDEFTIVCPIAGIPFDEPHRSKYITLLAEHEAAMLRGGWDTINGPFLDDAAHPRLTEEIRGAAVKQMEAWFFGILPVRYDQVWFPAGVHHPDHDWAGEAATYAMYNDRRTARLVYEELPYRVLYPRHQALDSPFIRLGSPVGYDPGMLEAKRRLCNIYASQIGPDIERCLYVPERLWEIR